jgi:hypothetical protein
VIGTFRGRGGAYGINNCRYSETSAEGADLAFYVCSVRNSDLDLYVAFENRSNETKVVDTVWFLDVSSEIRIVDPNGQRVQSEYYSEFVIMQDPAKPGYWLRPGMSIGKFIDITCSLTRRESFRNPTDCGELFRLRGKGKYHVTVHPPVLDLCVVETCPPGLPEVPGEWRIVLFPEVTLQIDVQ